MNVLTNTCTGCTLHSLLVNMETDGLASVERSLILTLLSFFFWWLLGLFVMQALWQCLMVAVKFYYLQKRGLPMDVKGVDRSDQVSDPIPFHREMVYLLGMTGI